MSEIAATIATDLLTIKGRTLRPKRPVHLGQWH
ncbi:hypothetical protein S101258_03088 [Lactiplantibacillus plantarum subsp. plantarum]|uniref:Uncharacterized protein n=1 Tax=Lactiplantibacillus plantarum subsp. plantarum TaxID=337330 RepID=A0A2S3U1G1_LACPN|nr:hypothetical protein S101258_03088 [Lactiplantibacillus plantarum subsp. plantarum]